MEIKNLIEKRFINSEEFDMINEHEDYLNEHCGISGTGRGMLFVIYENNDGQRGAEVGQVVREWAA